MPMRRSPLRTRVWHLAALVVAVVLLAPVGILGSPAARAAEAPTIYVDGKHGSDTANDGRAPDRAFKTVKRGTWELRYGGHLLVPGLRRLRLLRAGDGYPVVRQRIGQRADRDRGTRLRHPGLRAPGHLGGARGEPTGRWRVDPAGSVRVPRRLDDAVVHRDQRVRVIRRGLREERVFVDTSQPLRRPKDVPSLADLQASPGSQYWNGKTLFVRLGGWGSPSDADPSTDPDRHTIEVPHYRGLLVASGSSYVTIRGFRIRHTTMGVGFTGSSSHGTVEDVDASYNNPMGFFTASSYHVFRRITGRRNTIQLVKLDNGAQHNLVERATGIENLGQGVKLTGASTRYNTIRNSTFSGGRNVPMNAGQYGGMIQGVDIEQGARNNTIASNSISSMRRGLMLYQANGSGGPLSDNVVKYNRFDGNDAAVVVWDGKFASAAGSGRVKFYRNTYTRNLRAVVVEAATRYKTFDHETIYRTGALCGRGGQRLLPQGRQHLRSEQHCQGDRRICVLRESRSEGVGVLHERHQGARRAEQQHPSPPRHGLQQDEPRVPLHRPGGEQLPLPRVFLRRLPAQLDEGTDRARWR